MQRVGADIVCFAGSWSGRRGRSLSEGSDSGDCGGFAIRIVDRSYDTSKCIWVRVLRGTWRFHEHCTWVRNPHVRQPFPKCWGTVEVRAIKPIHVPREDGSDVEWHFGHFNWTCSDSCDFVAAGYGNDQLQGEKWVLQDPPAVPCVCPCPSCANSCQHCRVFWADAC